MQNHDLKNMHWSHKFQFHKSKKKLKLNAHDKGFNKNLLKLYNQYSLVLGINKSKYFKAYSNKKLVTYQSKLMKKYFQNPRKYLKLDCDRLTATFNVTQKDVDKLLEGITTFPNSAYEDVFSVKKVSVGSINNKKNYKNEVGEQDNRRPFYTQCYRIEAFSDRRKFFILQIADGKHPKSTKQGFRIDFIPDRFTGLEIRMLFNHLKSLLSTKRYMQLIKNASITRVDLGLNFYGLLSPFVVVYNHAQRNRHKYSSTKWPKGRYVSETIYFASKRNSSHFILYEKLLKELKDDADHLQFANVDKLLPQLIATTRLERRHYPYREKCGACSKAREKVKHLKEKECKRHKRCSACSNCIICEPRYKKLKFAEFSDFPDRLTDLRFIDPKVPALLNKKRLSSLLKNKNHHNVMSLLVNRKRKSVRHNSYELNNDWLQDAKQKLLNQLSDLIMYPAKKRDAFGSFNPRVITVEEIKIHAKHVRELPQSQLYATPTLHYAKSKYTAQEKGVTSPINRNIIVVAGAGSGKTDTIIKRTAHLVKAGVIPSNICVLAYNVDAADQLIKSTAMGQISTFHSWCKRILENFYPIYKETKLLVSLRKHVNERVYKSGVENEQIGLFLESIGLPTNLQNTFLSLCSYHKNTGEKFNVVITSRNVKDFNAKELEKYFIDYEQKKHRQGYWDFDDILTTMLQKLKDDRNFRNSISNSMSHLIVDEVQDSSSVQWHIIELLRQNGVTLFLVGDPAQTIYGFRGADHQQMDVLSKNTQEFDIVELDRNFRSLPGILNLGNWIRHQIDPKYKSLDGLKLTSDLAQQQPQIAEFSEKSRMTKWVVEDVKRLLDDGVPLTNIMILCRTNKLVKKIKTSLKASLKIAIPDECVTTIHKTKGLDCTAVYLIDPRFGKVPYDNESEHHRLLYVGVTRAKEHLTICKSTSGLIPHISPSNTYILDRIPDSMVKIVN